MSIGMAFVSNKDVGFFGDSTFSQYLVCLCLPAGMIELLQWQPHFFVVNQIGVFQKTKMKLAM